MPARCLLTLANELGFGAIAFLPLTLAAYGQEF